MSEESIPDNLDRLDIDNGLAVSPGPARGPAPGQRRVHRAIHDLADADLLEAIAVRPDILDLFDEQRRRDLERFQELRNRPEEWAAYIAAMPQEALELLDRHTLHGFYARELYRRKRQAESEAAAAPTRPAPAPAPAEPAGHTHSFSSVAASWEVARREVERAGGILAGPKLREVLAAHERVMRPPLTAGPIKVGDFLYFLDLVTRKPRRIRLRYGSKVRVDCPAGVVP